ncbi:MAG: sugar ABC transporter permease [Anaerolineales bacterium]
MRKREQQQLIIMFLIPGLLIYLIFNVYPSVRGILISLYDWSGLSGNMNFVGLANFAELWKEFTDPFDFYNIRRYLSHNLFLIVFGFITTFLGLVAAAIINEKPWGYQLFRITFFFPNVLAIPAIAMLWSLTLNPAFGLVNNFLNSVGLEEWALPWLSLQYQWPLFKIGLYTVGFITIWSGLGWFMLLFLAAIQNIPRELVEAALLDGANRMNIFFSITIPLIWETIRTVLLYNVIGALSGFALTYVLFDRVSQKHADLIMSYFYWQSFKAHNWGYAAALVVVIFVVTLIVTLFSYKALYRESVQY